MTSISFRRCPTDPTPSAFKSSADKLGRTVSSISLSRNAASYCSKPSLRSQSPTSMAAAPVRLTPHDPSGETACLECRFFDDRFGSFADILLERAVVGFDSNSRLARLLHHAGFGLIRSEERRVGKGCR